MIYVTLFVAAALISTSLLLIAVVLYIGDLIGSILLSLLIVGVTMALLAWLIYRGVLRPTFRAIGDQLKTIYDVASVAQVGYNWVATKVEVWIQKWVTNL